MGKIVELSCYRTKRRTEQERDIRVHAEPPYLVVRHYQDGVVVQEERLISEHLIRSFLEQLS